MFHLKHLCLILFLLMIPGSQATKITVQPGQSIQAAIDASHPGDIVEVLNGTYYENLNVTKRITLRGVRYPVVDASQKDGAIILFADGIALEGFTITNASYSENLIGVSVRGSDCSLAANNVLGNDYGIVVAGSNNSTLENNTASGSIIGILLAKANNNQISNNNATNNGGSFLLQSGGIILVYSSNNTLAGNVANDPYNGIYLRYSDSNRVEDNLAGSISGNGISVLDSGNNLIKDNLASDCYQNGVYLDNSSNNTVEGNRAQRNYNYG